MNWIQKPIFVFVLPVTGILIAGLVVIFFSDKALISVGEIGLIVFMVAVAMMLGRSSSIRIAGTALALFSCGLMTLAGIIILAVYGRRLGNEMVGL